MRARYFPKIALLSDCTSDSKSSSNTLFEGSPLWNRSEVPDDRWEELPANVNGIMASVRFDKIQLAEKVFSGNQKDSEKVFRKLENKQNMCDAKLDIILDLSNMVTLSSDGYHQGPLGHDNHKGNVYSGIGEKSQRNPEFQDLGSKAGMLETEGSGSKSSYRISRKSTSSRKNPTSPYSESDQSFSGTESDSSKDSSPSSSPESGSKPSSNERKSDKSFSNESPSWTNSDRKRRKSRWSKRRTSRKSTNETKARLEYQELSRASPKSR